jgi:hypothetical protein
LNAVFGLDGIDVTLHYYNIFLTQNY